MIIEWIIGILMMLCVLSFIRYIIFMDWFCIRCSKYIPKNQRLEWNDCCSSECYEKEWKKTRISINKNEHT